ncbi:MAG: hypothetical protein S4CHLAM37_10400 [Chlamydiia bacterium]|nr:hypothetical protein [Chlamydiia bacterium]
MKRALCLIILFITSLKAEELPTYHMITADYQNDEVFFHSADDFKEAMHAGFFRIKVPEDFNLECGREFARSFNDIPKYNQFGMLDVVNGYLQSKVAQTVRFTLERDHWGVCHKNKQLVQGPSNYPLEVQKLGHQISHMGVQVLRSILKGFGIPKDLWFQATGGASEGEGSQYLLFNCYDPKIHGRKEGLGEHKDWGYIALLDATTPGLQAKIDGKWRAIPSEDGYLIINFGYPLEKLLPEVKASEHRVAVQNEEMRTSTVVFIDPRVGPFRSTVKTNQKEGYVYDWDANERKLINPESTISFFTRLSNELYGEDQE